MDKFLEKLFNKIANYHQGKLEVSQSMVENHSKVPLMVIEQAKHDYQFSQLLWLNKHRLPHA